MITWILVDGIEPKGSPRYLVFNSKLAKRAAMSAVQRGKRNNLNKEMLKDYSEYLDWNSFLWNTL
jgi:hypothetical protein